MGILPSEVEARVTAAEFWELVAYFQLQHEQEEKYRREAEMKSKHPR